MKVLVLTVGGSHAPLLTAIESIQPDRVVFLCSDDIGKFKGSYTQVEGEGMVLCSKRPKLEKPVPDQPNIKVLAGLVPDQCSVIKIRDFDSLQECYRAAAQAIASVRSKFPNTQIIADYTGGTKSMTAGLALAAVDNEQCELRLVTGTRSDLSTVQHGTQFSHPVVVSDLRARLKLQGIEQLLGRFDYAAAAQEFESIGATHISESLVAAVRVAITACRAFDAWDRFDHLEARRLLQPCKDKFIEVWLFLEELCLNDPKDPYLKVEDLLLNAERRITQNRFDDAVARLYRALEMLAQIRLQTKYGVNTSDVKTDQIPTNLRTEFEGKRRSDGKLLIGLRDAWVLLANQQGEILRDWFEQNNGRILSFLTLRNQSILAHGAQPVGKTKFVAQGKEGSSLCYEALGTISANERGKRAAVQLPQQLPWLHLS